MNKFIVLLTLGENPDLAQLQSLEQPEAERVWQLYEAGTLTEIYLADDRSGAVVVLRTTDHDEAASVIESLPMVQAGALKPRYLGLVPWPEMTRMLDENGRAKPEWWPASDESQ